MNKDYLTWLDIAGLATVNVKPIGLALLNNKLL